MPMRIYALAKQLKLDSKVLADICTKAGITGKGSALASLSDDEMAKLTAYMDKSKARSKPTKPQAEAAPAKPGVVRREDYLAPTGTGGGKVRLLEPVQKASQEPPATEEPAKEPPTPETPTPETPTPETPTPEKSAPAIKLAPMPTAAETAKPAKSKEPLPQRPDIKLPLDAIRAGKKGTEPLSKHLRKHEEKKAAQEKVAQKKPTAKKPGSKAAPGGPPVPTEDTKLGRERRRGRPAAAGAEPGAAGLGGREARQLKRKRSGPARGVRGDARGGGRMSRGRRRTQIRRTGVNTAAPRKGKVVVQLPCTIRTFSEALGISASAVIGKMMELGTMANINADLDGEMAELLAVELGAEVDIRQEATLEDKLTQELQQEDDPDSLKPRPPIVTFLGHVDHGKTSLLDRIIGIDVVSGEKGGITQHIRAYRVEKEGRAIAFVDTPGHEAFTEMRARGANVTDIAVLVVAADDGVMPQTEEAISHARAAEVPIVVALNKIDLPGVSAQRALEQLAANELLPTEWGGDIEVIKTSAITGEGVDELLETLLTVAELHEYSANPDRPATGTCLEAELHEGRGVVAKLLNEKGTLRVGDLVVCGPAYGRIKAMYDTLNPRKRHKEVGPSTPVNVTGLNIPPGAGDHFHVLDDISLARNLAEQRLAESRQRELGQTRPHVTLENLFERLEEEEVQMLNVILRADVRGSIEAIRKELTKLEHAEVQIKILQASVGGITEADVHLADASDAVIIGFSVVPDEGARLLADQRGVQIRRYDIIYQITDDLRLALEGMLKPEELERELGRALVQQTFQISRLGTIAGCRVLAGTIERNARIRVIRESRVIGDYKLDSLKRVKDDAREVREGYECGIRLAGFNDLKQGDVLEAYKIEEVRRTFDTETVS